MEESNEWRNPIDLIAICERAFELIPAALEAGRRMRARSWSGRDELASVILGEDPQAIADALLSTLGDGVSPEELAGTVVYAAALRISRFHISKEDGDFHAIQDFEAAVRLHSYRNATPAGAHALVATARYLAAHSPTVRAQGQTWNIATRLHRGDRLFEE